MRPARNIIAIAAAAFIMFGCGSQSRLVGTWVETSEASPAVDGEANLVIFRDDGTTVDQTMRNGRLETSMPSTYRIKGDVLIVEDDEPSGCIRSEFAHRFVIEGDTLVLDDGTTRTTYQRLPRPVCLGVRAE